MAASKKSSSPDEPAEVYNPVGDYPARSYEEAKDPKANPEIPTTDRPDAPEGYVLPDHRRIVPVQPDEV